MQTLLFLIGFTFLGAFVEEQYDKRLAAVLDEGGRTKAENELLHEKQLSWRVLLIVLLSYGFIADSETFWQVTFSLIRNLALVGWLWWIFLDILVNKLWLKEKLFFTGSTSRWDRWFSGWKGLVVKIIGLTIIIAERFGYLQAIWEWIF